MVYDLVIRNGTVVDGSGRSPFAADIGVSDGLIVSIGSLDSSGRIELDAEGHVVTPGFIDGHTHMDAQVMWDPLGSSSCWHGVTTVVMGNCGFSLAPVRSEARSLVVRNLERAEDISPAAMDAGIDWSWETFSQYLDTVDHRQKGVNYAAYVGHSALRTWAMGERAFEEEANDEDLADMERQLADALDSGAIGFSTSQGSNHETSDDRPVASRMASWDEIRRLLSVLSGQKRGLFELALAPAARTPDEAVRSDYTNRLKDLALETSVPITFGVLGGIDEHLLGLIERTNGAGGVMFGQSHCRGIAGVRSFKTTLPFDQLPEWREVRARSVPDQLRMLSDPAVRNRLIQSAEQGDYGRAIGAEARKPDFDHLYVMNRPMPPHPTVAWMAADRGVHPVELMIDLALDSSFDQFFIQPISSEDPVKILPFLKHPGTVMTFSDSGAHVSQIIDSSIQTHFLAYWVRSREEFTLAQGVRMLTSVPAKFWGIGDRGLLREGMVADVNVFDAERIVPTMPEIRSDLPGDARRLVQRADGILATVVSGEVVLSGGESTGSFPGKLLRDAGRHEAIGAGQSL
jgi:N-acyl-D-amino-acid deacylase